MPLSLLAARRQCRIQRYATSLLALLDVSAAFNVMPASLLALLDVNAVFVMLSHLVLSKRLEMVFGVRSCSV